MKTRGVLCFFGNQNWLIYARVFESNRDKEELLRDKNHPQGGSHSKEQRKQVDAVYSI